MNALRRDVRRRLQDLADPEAARKIRVAVPNARAMGVAVPRIRALAAELRPRVSFDEACGLLDGFCRDGWREEILLGTFLLAGHRRRLGGLEWRRLETWIEAIDNWETCDQIAANIAAPMVAARDTLASSLAALAESSNPWRRRFALAIAASLNQRGRFFPDITLQICRRLLADPDPMIQKSLAWALRELSKKDAGIAFRFLSEHRDAMRASTLRDASQKLPVPRQASSP